MYINHILLSNSMNCPKCKKKNLEDSNFCSRCGFDISQFKMKQCSICLEKTKNQEILICGHSFVLDVLKFNTNLNKNVLNVEPI